MYPSAHTQGGMIHLRGGGGGGGGRATFRAKCPPAPLKKPCTCEWKSVGTKLAGSVISIET